MSRADYAADRTDLCRGKLAVEVIIAVNRIVFLCTGNSCRSQMAEGILRNLGQGRYEAMSAGTHPKGLHPLAAKVMNEIDMGISAQRSKDLHAVDIARVDWVITVCDRAKESCPVLPRPNFVKYTGRLKIRPTPVPI